jgi:hypothetical protein
MIYMTYDANIGTAMPDGRVFGFVRQLMLDNERHPEVSVTVSSQLIISEIRVFIHYGLINQKDVKIFFEREHIKFDGDSHCLSRWPKGFCDVWDEQLNALVQWGNERDLDVPDRYVEIA